MTVLDWNRVASYCRASEEPVRAAIYLRSASGNESDLETQRAICLAHCRLHGWHVPQDRIFVDVASGLTLDRPGLNALRQLASRGVVNMVVTSYMDRITRKTPDFYSLVFGEWRGRCGFVAVKNRG